MQRLSLARLSSLGCILSDPCSCLAVFPSNRPTTCRSGVAITSLLARLNRTLDTQIVMSEPTHALTKQWFVSRGVDLVEFVDTEDAAMQVCEVR